MGMANIVNVNSRSSFQSEVLDSNVPVVVDFWAAWCGPCRAVAPELEILAEAYGEDVRVVKVDVDLNTDIAAEYGVQTIPTIALFRSGKWVAATVGAKRARVIEGDLGLASVAGV
jgi:thioredoxin